MPKVRARNLYNPKSKEPFKLSRSKIELFLSCPKCFYLDRRLGIGQPGGLPFTLNSAVDALLKKEFDIHRIKKQAHPLMEDYKIKAIPFDHEKINEWRENFKGVQYLHEPTNFLITGAVDDVWIDRDGKLLVVDYKATSTSAKITLENEYRQSYKRQIEIYQWLLRQNGFKVSDTGYFVYANGKKDRCAFDGKLEFDIEIISYVGSDKWVEKAIVAAHKCLNSEKLPKPASGCEYCNYREAVREKEKGG